MDEQLLNSGRTIGKLSEKDNREQRTRSKNSFSNSAFQHFGLLAIDERWGKKGIGSRVQDLGYRRNSRLTIGMSRKGKKCSVGE